MTDVRKLAETGRTSLWKAIAATLHREIDEGVPAPGDKLPTEAELAKRFSVNRHTVRRALAHLAEQDVIRSRRGSGVFVQAQPVDYPLGPNVRYRQNLSLAGRLPGRRLLSLATRPATKEDAEALGLDAGASVVCGRGVSLADGRPIALYTSVFPDEMLPGIAHALETLGSVTSALAACGVKDYRRLRTRITAEVATADQVLLLEAREGAALTVTDGVSVDPQGRAVQWGRTWFLAERVTLVVEGN